MSIWITCHSSVCQASCDTALSGRGRVGVPLVTLGGGIPCSAPARIDMGRQGWKGPLSLPKEGGELGLPIGLSCYPLVGGQVPCHCPHVSCADTMGERTYSSYSPLMPPRWGGAGCLLLWVGWGLPKWLSLTTLQKTVWETPYSSVTMEPELSVGQQG